MEESVVNDTKDRVETSDASNEGSELVAINSLVDDTVSKDRNLVSALDSDHKNRVFGVLVGRGVGVLRFGLLLVGVALGVFVKVAVFTGVGVLMIIVGVALGVGELVLVGVGVLGTPVLVGVAVGFNIVVDTILL